MILVIGGSFQGKLEFVRRQWMEGQPGNGWYARGDKDSYETALERPVLYGLHHYIRRIVKEGGSVDTFLTKVLAGQAQIILLDEIGCGLVPMEAGDRQYREETGRAGQRLALEASEVWRVLCGVGQKIK